MRRLFFALAMIAVFFLGGLVYESASAQNSNSSTTMGPTMEGRHNRRHRRHYRRWQRRHRRAGRRGGNSNT